MAKRKKSAKKNLEDLWAELIKKIAGYRCELTGKNYGLESHHICGKATNLLRFSLLSGMCLTTSKHIFGIHNPDREEDVRNEIINKRPITIDGLNIIERLNKLKHQGHRVTLEDCEAYLNEMERRIDNGDIENIDWIVPAHALVKYHS